MKAILNVHFNNMSKTSPNNLLQPGPTHVVPLFTARLRKSLRRPSGREMNMTYNGIDMSMVTLNPMMEHNK
jgi:hypothetical protein